MPNVIMPALGMDQDTGTLVRWIKHEGEAVAQGEPIMEIETDKVVVEIEATGSGVLANVSAAEGDEIPVGQVIAQIVDKGSAPAPPSFPRAQGSESANRTTPPPILREGLAADATGSRTLASPKARRLAREQGIDVSSVRGSGPEGAVLARDIGSAPAPTPPPILGEGPDARPVSPTPTVGEGPGVGAPAVSRAWQVMAERMTSAWTTIPHFVLVREVDASALRDMRERISPAVSQRSGVAPSYTDLLVKLIAAAIVRQPRINVSWREGTIEQHADANVGIAVATDDGLIVPVVHSAAALSVGEIAERRRDLVARATAGKLTPADISGGTFTLSNLGMYGVDAFAAIVNPPQAAILAVGRIADRVIAVDGQAAVRPTLILTLSCDHRAIDGARAAQFLDELVALIEEPWGLLA